MKPSTLPDIQITDVDAMTDAEGPESGAGKMGKVDWLLDLIAHLKRGNGSCLQVLPSFNFV